MMLGRTWTSWRRAALVIVLGVGLAACGDDDGGRPPASDGGFDAGGGGGDTDGGGGGGGGTDGGGSGGTDGGGGGGTRVCMPPGGECDVMLQNCPNATDGCYYVRVSEDSPDTTLCAPAGNGDDGDPCTYANDCLPGLTCPNGTCRAYCCEGRTSDCPAGSGQTCIGLGGSENIGTCTAPTACSLAPPGGCPSGQGCYPVGNDGTLGCFAAGTDPEGASCEFLNGCAPGHGCYPVSGVSSCIRFCRIDRGQEDCTGGRTCQMVTGVALPANIGICPPST